MVKEASSSMLTQQQLCTQTFLLRSCVQNQPMYPPMKNSLQGSPKCWYICCEHFMHTYNFHHNHLAAYHTGLPFCKSVSAFGIGILWDPDMCFLTQLTLWCFHPRVLQESVVAPAGADHGLAVVTSLCSKTPWFPPIACPWSPCKRCRSLHRVSIHPRQDLTSPWAWSQNPGIKGNKIHSHYL